LGDFTRHLSRTPYPTADSAQQPPASSSPGPTIIPIVATRPVIIAAPKLLLFLPDRTPATPRPMETAVLDVANHWLRSFLCRSCSPACHARPEARRTAIRYKIFENDVAELGFWIDTRFLYATGIAPARYYSLAPQLHAETSNRSVPPRSAIRDRFHSSFNSIT